MCFVVSHRCLNGFHHRWLCVKHALLLKKRGALCGVLKPCIARASEICCLLRSLQAQECFGERRFVLSMEGIGYGLSAFVAAAKMVHLRFLAQT